MVGTIGEVHPELFHYTTAAGLDGILKSQTLRATHASFMNDALEIRAFKARLPDILRAAVRDGMQRVLDIPANEELVRNAGGKDAAVEEAVRAVVEGMYAALLGTAGTPAFMDAYVLSFCTAATQEVSDHGLLSQWRGYGDDGGYAIVFDTVLLDSLVKEEAEKWHYDVFGGDVIYSSDPDEKILEEFGQDIEQLKKCVAEFFRTAHHHLTFARCLARMKGSGHEIIHRKRRYGELNRLIGVAIAIEYVSLDAQSIHLDFHARASLYHALSHLGISRGCDVFPPRSDHL
jgi:hypothetical protein